MLYKGHKTVFHDETSLGKCIRLLVLLVKGAKNRMIKIECIEWLNEGMKEWMNKWMNETIYNDMIYKTP